MRRSADVQVWSIKESTVARFRCGACETEGTIFVSPKRECPNCGSIEIQTVLSTEEWANGGLPAVAFTQMAENNKVED
jgi:uncharacterized OB-fold protein